MRIDITQNQSLVFIGIRRLETVHLEMVPAVVRNVGGHLNHLPSRRLHQDIRIPVRKQSRNLEIVDVTIPRINRIGSGHIRFTLIVFPGQHLVITDFDTDTSRNIPYRIDRFLLEIRTDFQPVRVGIARFIANAVLQIFHIVNHILMVTLHGLLHVFGRQVLRCIANLVSFQDRIAQFQITVPYIKNGRFVRFQIGTLQAHLGFIPHHKGDMVIVKVRPVNHHRSTLSRPYTDIP